MDLVGGTRAGQGSGVLLDLARRAAGVVERRGDQHPGANRVRVGDRRGLAVALGDLLRAASEEGAVHRLYVLAFVLVGGFAVGDGGGGDAHGPQVRLHTQAQQRQVAAPGGAGQHQPRGVHDALVDRPLTDRDDVLQFGQPDAAAQCLRPLLAIAAGAAVVEAHDGEAVVDPGGGFDVEGVTVLLVGAAVQQEHRRVRGLALDR